MTMTDIEKAAAKLREAYVKLPDGRCRKMALESLRVSVWWSGHDDPEATIFEVRDHGK